MSSDDVALTMQRLCAAERARREAIDALISLGVVRSRRLVGDLGEALAARYYRAELASNANTPGYDLVTQDGRCVQVRALRSEPHRERTVMGVMREPYDVLFAIKFSVDYEPLRAIEVSRAVLERYYPHGHRTSWTKRLENDPDVERIPRAALINPREAERCLETKHAPNSSRLRSSPADRRGDRVGVADKLGPPEKRPA